MSPFKLPTSDIVEWWGLGIVGDEEIHQAGEIQSLVDVNDISGAQCFVRVEYCPSPVITENCHVPVLAGWLTVGVAHSPDSTGALRPILRTLMIILFSAKVVIEKDLAHIIVVKWYGVSAGSWCPDFLLIQV